MGKYVHYFWTVILCCFIYGCSVNSNNDHASLQVIASDDAPEAIGPYSQGIRAGNFLFLAGQIPLDPESGEIVGESVEEQTRLVLENLGAVLREAGMSYANVVKSFVYLSDLDEFGAMNSVYAEYFQDNPPSRATVEVSRLPRDVKVEISAIAYQP